MTRTEYNQLLSQLPESVRKEYGFNEPFDYSPYKCIHTDEYDYYPELDCCVIQEIPIVWESGNPWVTPENPEILKGFKEIIKNSLSKCIYAVHMNYNNKIDCQLYNCNQRVLDMIQKHGLTKFTNVNDKKVWYNPNDIDLPHRADLFNLIDCLFYAKQYNYIGLTPEKNVPSNEWMAVEFI